MEIKHIYWEANIAVDWLSKSGHSIIGALLTTEYFNTELQNIVKDDVIGRTLVRRSA